MEIKIFNGKKIKIRQISKKDLKNAEKFQNFINSLIEEDVQISLNKKSSLKEEKKWLKEQLKQIIDRKTVLLVAECDKKIIGITDITLNKERQIHVGNFGITIRKNYRGIGLGSYLIEEIIKLAKKELKPQPKIIRLSVFSTNKPAIGLYKKFGFKRVAKIPKQFQYKGKLINEIVMLKEI
jgi:ribosomal protein S18 acetylase RimI-like enzyme